MSNDLKSKAIYNETVEQCMLYLIPSVEGKISFTIALYYMDEKLILMKQGFETVKDGIDYVKTGKWTDDVWTYLYQENDECYRIYYCRLGGQEKTLIIEKSEGGIFVFESLQAFRQNMARKCLSVKNLLIDEYMALADLSMI